MAFTRKMSKVPTRLGILQFLQVSETLGSKQLCSDPGQKDGDEIDQIFAKNVGSAAIFG